MKKRKTLNERFVDIADWVSEAMGTPANIIFWLLAVLIWFLLFAFNPNLQNSNFLPAWFTSNSFNFPLNSITTLAELYIGFLVAAAANRVEKRNREMQEQQAKIIQHIDKTASQEESEVADAETRLLEQDGRILSIAHHLDAQDKDILTIVKRLDKQEQLQTELLEKLSVVLEMKLEETKVRDDRQAEKRSNGTVGRSGKDEAGQASQTTVGISLSSYLAQMPAHPLARGIDRWITSLGQHVEHVIWWQIEGEAVTPHLHKAHISVMFAGSPTKHDTIVQYSDFELAEGGQ